MQMANRHERPLSIEFIHPQKPMSPPYTAAAASVILPEEDSIISEIELMCDNDQLTCHMQSQHSQIKD